MRTALTEADTAFQLLVRPYAPLAVDGRTVPGLPQRMVPLDELRSLLSGPQMSGHHRDGAWRLLLARARQDGPAWVVGAVGVAVPKLTGIAARLARSSPVPADDIDAEVLTGFLHAVRTADPEPVNLWPRLCWAARRAGLAASRPHRWERLPADVPCGGGSPARPYGHPDLILGRARAAQVITAEQAYLISATRVGGVPIDRIAREGGESPAALRMRRTRGERQLIAALLRGDLAVPPHSGGGASQAGQVRSDRPGVRPA